MSWPTEWALNVPPLSPTMLQEAASAGEAAEYGEGRVLLARAFGQVAHRRVVSVSPPVQRRDVEEAKEGARCASRRQHAFREHARKSTETLRKPGTGLESKRGALAAPRIDCCSPRFRSGRQRVSASLGCLAMR